MDPGAMRSKITDKSKNDCNVTIISLVQWYVGKKEQNPLEPAILFSKFKGLFHGALRCWVERGGSDFYIREPHYNALGDIKFKCPTIDRRCPIVEIVRNVCLELNVKYIDTSA